MVDRHHSSWPGLSANAMYFSFDSKVMHETTNEPSSLSRAYEPWKPSTFRSSHFFAASTRDWPVPGVFNFPIMMVP